MQASNIQEVYIHNVQSAVQGPRRPLASEQRHLSNYREALGAENFYLIEPLSRRARTRGSART